MPRHKKSKKTQVANKVLENSSKSIKELERRAQAISESLGNSSKPTGELKKELTSITQSLNALSENIQLKIAEIKQKHSDDNPLQDGGIVNLISYNHSIQQEEDEMKKDEER